MQRDELSSITASSFWVPRLLVDSAWCEHAPFAFWLTEVHRPRLLVELGVHRGFSYCCFCQAIKELGLETKAFAVDTWTGDQHSGFYSESVFHELVQYHERYAEFSTLMRSTFDAALSTFEDNSIDLLHIDGRHYYEDVKHDFESWLPKLSSRGVVLFHDTNVREREFGVFKLWSELAATYPCAEFFHGHGLGVLGFGLEIEKPLRELFKLGENPARAHGWRTAYSRLGAAIASISANEALRRVNQDDEKSLAEARAQTALLQAEHHRLSQILDATKQRLAAEQQASAHLQYQLCGIRNSLSWKAMRPFRAVNNCLRSSFLTLRLFRRAFRASPQTVTTFIGAFESVAQSGLFNAGYYRAKYNDVQNSNYPPYLHFLRYGARELRKPHPLFDTEYYLSLSHLPLSRAHEILGHYQRMGQASGLRPNAFFDPLFYLSKNADVAETRLDPLVHYYTTGWHQGRNPSADFSTSTYLELNPDVAEAGINPLEHYLEFGQFEGRRYENDEVGAL